MNFSKKALGIVVIAMFAVAVLVGCSRGNNAPVDITATIETVTENVITELTAQVEAEVTEAPTEKATEESTTEATTEATAKKEDATKKESKTTTKKSSKDKKTTNQKTTKANAQQIVQQTEYKKDGSTVVKISVDGKDFNAYIFDEQAAKSLKSLPVSNLVMADSNGTSKVCNFGEPIANNGTMRRKLNAGEIAINGSSLVIAYRDFESKEQYSVIGRLDGSHNLASIFTPGDMAVEISVK